MGKMNKLLILSVSIIVLVALAGTASAKVTYKIDKIWANGYYTGSPVLLDGDCYQYGYEYTFHPDGMYTIFGTLTNDGEDSYTMVADFYSQAHWPSYGFDRDYITIPGRIGSKNGKVNYALTTKADSVADLAIWFWSDAGYDKNIIDLTNVDFEDEPDTTQHTIDQGPMSDTTVIYSNGKLVYNGLPQYSVSLY